MLSVKGGVVFFIPWEIARIDLAVLLCLDAGKTTIGKQTDINIGAAMQSKQLSGGRTVCKGNPLPTFSYRGKFFA